MRYIKGNLFEYSTDVPLVIVHGCNAQGVMGSGVAKEFKTRYPSAYAQYKKDISAGFRPGSVSWKFHSDDLFLASAITQEYYGKDGRQYVSYDAIEQCIRIIFRMLKNTETEVIMPKIGAGLGGGDWAVIEDIIVKSALLSGFDEKKITVFEL